MLPKSLNQILPLLKVGDRIKIGARDKGEVIEIGEDYVSVLVEGNVSFYAELYADEDFPKIKKLS